MRRAFYILLLLMTLAFKAAAQSDFDAPRWTKFEPQREEFSLEFPTSSVTSAGRSSDEARQAQYLAVQNKAFFAVLSSDAPDEELLTSVLGWAEGEVATKEVEISGIKGKRYDFTDADEFKNSLVTIQAPAHFYIFHVISETRDGEAIEHFFDSIKLDRAVPKPSDAPREAKEPTSTAGRDAVLKSTGTGTGISGGIGLPPETEIAPPKYAKVDSPVTILSKPRAAYTTLGRRYQITGMVKLRVAFMANGTIGTITPVAKLPLGLTQSAISTARRIRFSPAVRKGDPYTTSKVVEFEFKLY